MVCSWLEREWQGWDRLLLALWVWVWEGGREVGLKADEGDVWNVYVGTWV